MNTWFTTREELSALSTEPGFRRTLLSFRDRPYVRVFYADVCEDSNEFAVRPNNCCGATHTLVMGDEGPMVVTTLTSGLEHRRCEYRVLSHGIVGRGDYGDRLEICVEPYWAQN